MSVNAEKCELEVFIKAWQESASISEVSTKTGYSTRSASKKAFKLRKRGVPMKKYPSYYGRDGRRDWDKYAAYAKSQSVVSKSGGK